MTPEQFQTILSNQGILGELYREQKYQRHLAKNRAEKMRSRLRKQGVFP
jgi:ribosomal protein L35